MSYYLDGDGLGVKQALSDIKRDEADMRQTFTRIDADALRDAKAISRGAIAKMGDVVNKYMSTYVFYKDRGGNTRISQGGLPAYIVTSAASTYAQALKRAFGGANVSDIMLTDDKDARMQADTDYKQFLNSMFVIQQ